jgi:hypothetical protein
MDVYMFGDELAQLELRQVPTRIEGHLYGIHSLPALEGIDVRRHDTGSFVLDMRENLAALVFGGLYSSP